MSPELVKKIQNLGLSEKAARMYLSALKQGGGFMQDLAKEAGVPRTSLYYTLDELLEAGALVETKLGQRKYYQAIPPKQLLELAKEKLQDAAESLPDLEAEAGKGKTSTMEILRGPQGFKLAWDEILQNKDKEYRIITSGESFLDYVKEKYVTRTIIGRKKMLKVKSYQLIPDTPYGRGIVERDRNELRESRFLPANIKLPYTIVFSSDKVLIVTSRSENLVLLWNSPKFATTMRALFDELWAVRSPERR